MSGYDYDGDWQPPPKPEPVPIEDRECRGGCGKVVGARGWCASCSPREFSAEERGEHDREYYEREWDRRPL
jgi:hypothetical protein